MSTPTPVLKQKSTTERRCAGCGQRLTEPLPPTCPLCGFHFGEERITGADVTPYAQAYSRGEHSWRLMSEWVWFARIERLKHIALMQASAASRRFARPNLLLLAFAAGFWLATVYGFKPVSASAAVEPSHSVTPTGTGWVHLAAAPKSSRVGAPPEIKVDLWWNPTQSALVFAIGAVTSWLIAVLILALIRSGLTAAHEVKYRSEQRMTAALSYSTAWAIPLVIAAFLASLLPISSAGKMAQWAWYPPRDAIVLSAAVVAGFAAAMWWFWLLRLGFTAPPSSRGRVSFFFAVGVPIIVVGVGAAWWFGLAYLFAALFKAIRLDF